MVDVFFKLPVYVRGNERARADMPSPPQLSERNHGYDARSAPVDAEPHVTRNGGALSRQVVRICFTAAVTSPPLTAAPDAFRCFIAMPVA